MCPRLFQSTLPPFPGSPPLPSCNVITDKKRCTQCFPSAPSTHAQHATTGSYACLCLLKLFTAMTALPKTNVLSFISTSALEASVRRNLRPRPQWLSTSEVQSCRPEITFLCHPFKSSPCMPAPRARVETCARGDVLIVHTVMF